MGFYGKVNRGYNDVNQRNKIDFRETKTRWIMEILLLLVSVFALTLALLVGLVVMKIVRKRKLPDNYYTPFDYITSQVLSEFHEEKEEATEEENDQSYDK